MPKEFKLIFRDEKRKKMWDEILDGNPVYVEKPYPEVVKFEGKRQLIYKLDLNLITIEQREKIIIKIAEEFEMDKLRVSRMFEEHGVPINSRQCVVEVVAFKPKSE